MSATIDNNSDFIEGKVGFFHDSIGTAARRPCRIFRRMPFVAVRADDHTSWVASCGSQGRQSRPGVVL